MINIYQSIILISTGLNILGCSPLEQCTNFMHQSFVTPPSPTLHTRGIVGNSKAKVQCFYHQVVPGEPWICGNIADLGSGGQGFCQQNVPTWPSLYRGCAERNFKESRYSPGRGGGAITND